MRFLFTFIFFCLLIFPAFSQEKDVFSIESEEFSQASSELEMSVKDSLDEFKECQILQQEIKPDLYVVTTANACNWGAYTGPIWLVEKRGDAFQLLLSDRGNELRILNQDNYPDIKVSGGSAGHYSARLWQRDEGKYTMIEKVYFPADCKEMTREQKEHPFNPFECD